MKTSVFVWRDEILGYREAGARGLQKACPFCTTELLYSFDGRGDILREYEDCPLCGWYSHVCFEDEFGDYDCDLTYLKSFDINSPELPLRELGTCLKRNYADIYGLSWLRFEKLVADVFREHGFLVIPTPPTKDGGADMILLENSSSGVHAIVEAKRYAEDRKVGVSLVRQLMGAAIHWGIKRAYLVTSSGYTSGSRQIAYDYGSRGYEIDLVDATDLLRMLQVYNEKLPPLHLLTREIREGITNENRLASPNMKSPKASIIEAFISNRSFDDWQTKWGKSGLSGLFSYSVTGFGPPK